MKLFQRGIFIFGFTGHSGVIQIGKLYLLYHRPYSGKLEVLGDRLKIGIFSKVKNIGDIPIIEFGVRK